MDDVILPPREFKDLDNYYRNTAGGPSDAKEAADDLANTCLNEDLRKDLMIQNIEIEENPNNPIIVNPKQMFYYYSTSDHQIRDSESNEQQISSPTPDDEPPIQAYKLGDCPKVEEEF